MNELVLMGEKRPQDCWDWITREEACRFAMRSFDLVQKGCKPPRGERFLIPGDAMGWSSRVTFAEHLAVVFELHVKAEAHGLGLGAGDFRTEAARLLVWEG